MSDKLEFYDRNDMKLAELFEREYGSKVKYIVDKGVFVVDSGQCWKETAKAEIEALVKDFLQKIPQHTDPAVMHYVKSIKSQRSIEAIVKSIKSQRGIMKYAADFDTHHYRLNLLNGVMNLKNFQLEPYKADLYLTRLCPVVYDPAAKSELFRKFIASICNNDPDLIEAMQRIAGYILTGATYEEVAFIFQGKGSNGKSTFIRLMQALLGNYAQQAPSDLLTAQARSVRDDLADLPGFRLVVVQELNQGTPINESLLKQLTGRDKLRARRLYGQYFEYMPIMKLIVVSNYPPQIRGRDHGIWRRLFLFPFLASFKKENLDPQLYDKLLSDLPALLNWALEGCKKWQADGLFRPKAIEAALNAYREDMDSIGRFVDEWCYVDNDMREGTMVLYDAYAEYCRQNRFNRASIKEFGRALNDMGFPSVKSSTKFRDGLSLLNGGGVRDLGIELDVSILPKS